MSLSLPPSSSPLRQLFDAAADLVPLGQSGGLLKAAGFRDVRLNAPKFFASEKAAKSFTAITLRADGELWLVEFRRSGSWKKLWNFGRP